MAIWNIPDETTLVDARAGEDYEDIAAGDIIQLNYTRTARITFRGVTGASGNPVTIINYGGQVTMNAGGAWDCVQFRDCEYVRMTGTGDAGYTYGFRLRNAQFVCWMGYGTRYLEIDHCEIYDSTTNTGIYWNTADGQDGHYRSSFTIESPMIHDCYFHDTEGAGIYCGHAGGEKCRVNNVEIYDNLFEDIGLQAIQVGDGTNIYVHDNTIIRASQDPVEPGYGILLNQRTEDFYCYNNWIEDSGHCGIAVHTVSGFGPAYIYNNVIIRAGYIQQISGSRGIYMISGDDTTIYNNTIIESYNDGIYIVDGPDSPIVRHNISVGNGGDDIDNQNAETTLDNNYTGTVASMYFANASADDYHLTTSSPAKDTCTANYPSYDYDNVARPQGTYADAGAYEYQTSEPEVGNVVIATTRAACNLSTGTQDFISADCEGLTPKAALFLSTYATTDGSARAGSTFTIGAATGAAERWSLATQSNDNVADSYTGRLGLETACIYKLLTGGCSGQARADHSAFIENGERVNWITDMDYAELMTVLLFCGEAVSAYAGTFSPNATEDLYVDVSGVGFEADAILFFGGKEAFDYSCYTTLFNSLGAAVNDGSETQRCAAFHSEHNQAACEVHSYFSEARCFGGLSNGGGSFEYTIELSAFQADGFRATTRDGAADSGDEIGFLALNFGGMADVWLGTVTCPAGTGSDSVTGVGFEPQAAILGLTHMAATATHYTDGSAGAYGIAVLTENAQYCNAVAEEDAATTMNTQSMSDDCAVNLPEHDGTDGHVVTFTSFDSDGWTWNFTTNVPGAKKWWALAIQAAAAVSGERGTGRGIMRHVMRGI